MALFWAMRRSPAGGSPGPLPAMSGGLIGALTVLQTWITTALDLGATPEDSPRQEPFGAEAWLLDPERNRLLLLVLPAS